MNNLMKRAASAVMWNALTDKDLAGLGQAKIMWMPMKGEEEYQFQGDNIEDIGPCLRQAKSGRISHYIRQKVKGK